MSDQTVVEELPWVTWAAQEADRSAWQRQHAERMIRPSIELPADLVARCDRIAAMQDIGEEVRRIVEKNFEAGGRPERWKPSARSKRDGGKPLTDKGTLRRSMTVDADSKSVRVGTNVIYAGIHQFGGKAGRRRKVNIPARPFLVISDADQSRIEKMAEDYLGGIIK